MTVGDDLVAGAGVVGRASAGAAAMAPPTAGGPTA